MSLFSHLDFHKFKENRAVPVGTALTLSLYKMACAEVAGAHFFEFRHAFGTLSLRIAAACAERAARRRIKRRRDVATEYDSLVSPGDLRIRYRDSREKRLRVRMEGMRVDFACVCKLDHLSEIHDSDT